MSSQPPPPYEEIIAEDRAAQANPSALIVHLQVWHYRAEGRSPSNNDKLAALFRDSNLQAWEVVPFDAPGVTGPSSHDRYVPVEVRFRHRVWAYNDPGEHPMADVRELFFKTAPQFIYQFFIRINSTPHNLNIFPVGVPGNFSSRYTHAYRLNRLSIRVNTFVVPGPVNTNNVQSWLRDAISNTENVLKILSAIVTLFVIIRKDQDTDDPEAKAYIQQVVRRAEILGVDVPQQLGELRTLLEQFRGPDEPHVDPTPAEDLQVVLNNANQHLAKYIRLANRMESRLTKLENNLPLSNQDLYELVQDAHNGALVFSTLKQAVKPMVHQLETGYSTEIGEYQGDKFMWAFSTGAIAVISILLCSNPAGWATVGACVAGGALGGTGGAVGHSWMDEERGKASDKKHGVREFDIATKEVDRCANEARKAIAMVFCAQVMQMRVDENLPEHDRRAILATLGVDVDALSDAVYSQELVRDRIRRFRENNRKLRIGRERVLRDAGFESGTTEQGE